MNGKMYSVKMPLFTHAQDTPSVNATNICIIGDCVTKEDPCNITGPSRLSQ